MDAECKPMSNACSGPAHGIWFTIGPWILVSVVLGMVILTLPAYYLVSTLKTTYQQDSKDWRCTVERQSDNWRSAVERQSDNWRVLAGRALATVRAGAGVAMLPAAIVRPMSWFRNVFWIT